MNTFLVDTNELVNDGCTDLEGMREEDGSRLVVDDQIHCFVLANPGSPCPESIKQRLVNTRYNSLCQFHVSRLHR